MSIDKHYAAIDAAHFASEDEIDAYDTFIDDIIGEHGYLGILGQINGGELISDMIEADGKFNKEALWQAAKALVDAVESRLCTLADRRIKEGIDDEI